MWISFTKKPMNPIMQKPIAVATAIFWNSENKKRLFTINQENKIDVYLMFRSFFVDTY